ncbi:MAG: C13 family peptidase [Candidatus Nanoarchaeia archaeon]|nr:C13 family peptidase [Candidatus Nanoarchaeia archaeon]
MASKKRLLLPLAAICGALSCTNANVEEIPPDAPEKYAVLISGHTEERHALNMTLVYNFLLEHGFNENNIYVADGKGTDRLYCYPVDAAATVDNVRTGFESLQQKLDGNDLLFVYVSDHGGRIRAEDGSYVSTISTNDGSTLDQRTFAGFVDSLKHGQGIFVYDQCHSGGFAEETGHGNNVAIASTTADDSAYSGGIHNSFTAYFIKAHLYSQFSDTNHDGNVSLGEAFRFAERNHPYSVQGWQDPIIVSEQDPDLVYLLDKE